MRSLLTGEGDEVTAVDILLRLRGQNVRVWVANGELRYEAPSGALNGELRTQVEANAEDIVRYLENADDCVSSTHYVPMRDGVRIAIDIFRPKRNGEIVRNPLPAIWCHDRYHRSSVRDGLVVTKLDTLPWLRTVMRNGYVVAAADARGTGASSGSRHREFSEEETCDAYDITEWLAGQPWCDKRVGMYGDSYLGIAQLLASGTAPPHLKAIFPQMAMFDLYDFVYPGGVFREPFVRCWSEKVRSLDVEHAAAPVDGHSGALAEVTAEHQDNANVFELASAEPYRDAGPYRDQSPSAFLDAINSSGVAVHQISGWFDMWVRDALLWFANLRVPQKLTIGTCCHTDRQGIDLAGEHLRWFDYWLKDIDTGVMSEAPIRYQVINASDDQWRAASIWPPNGSVPSKLYLTDGPTGTSGSVNDGLLQATPPTDPGGLDEYVVDYTTSSGDATRWTNGHGGPFGYEPGTGNDDRSLTYTTDILPKELEVIGNPVVHLWISSTYPDGDFFVYLEDVDENGTSSYVTEGVIRASHRALAEPPFEYLGLPYHPCTREARKELSAAPEELVVDLHPTGYVFARGHRLRLAISCCDRGNARTPVEQPAPVVQVHRSARWTSYLSLPVMTAVANDPRGVNDA